jgi:hypothetical protein
MTAIHRLARALPSVLVAALVVAAAAAQSGPSNPLHRLLPAKSGAFARASVSPGAPGARDRRATPAGSFGTTSCEGVTFTASMGPLQARVWQPDAVTLTASSLSFAVSSGSGVVSTLTAEIAFFDPSASDPRLGSYPLHRSTLTAAGTGPEWLSYPLDRTIVVRETEPASVTVTAGLSFQPGTSDPLVSLYDPDGPSGYRAAVYVGSQGLVPLPGIHPVLAHKVCGATPDIGGLYVLQQVIRSDGIAAPAELVQTFTCSVTVTAQWVELAIASPPSTTSSLEVSIFDLQGAVQPPADPLSVTATAALLQGATLAPPVWGATDPLATPARLEAGHRYGLAVKTGGNWSLGVASSKGGAYYNGGALYSRNGPSGPFALETDRDLSFRLIGKPEVASPSGPPTCDLPALSQAVTVTAQFPLPQDRVVVQSITLVGENSAMGQVSIPGAPIPGSSVSVSLGVPGAPPDPGLIALRFADGPTRTCDHCDWSSYDLGMPLVTRAVTAVAQGGGGSPMLSWHVQPVTITASDLGYDEAAPSGLPPAMYRDGNGPWQMLPGMNPVIAHVVCPATATATAPWRAVQQVLRGGIEYPGTVTAELLQTFRVPVPTEVSWAELGLRSTETPSSVTFTASLMAPKPTSFSADPGVGISLAETMIASGLTGALSLVTALRPTALFPQSVTLTPGVDYWIHATPTAEWAVAASDASPYTDGRLYVSPASGVPLTEETDRDLAFRLIGVPRALMAEPITVPCQECIANVFDAVTTTADFGRGTGRRSFGQVVASTVTANDGSYQLELPMGSDGAAVTLTARVHFTEKLVGGLQVPSSSTYPLTSVTMTASAGDMRWAGATFDRPLVVQRWGNPATATANELAFVVEPPSEQAQGRAKVALGDPGNCSCTAGLTKLGSGGWQVLPGLSLGHVINVTPTGQQGLLELVAARGVVGLPLTEDVVQSFRVPAVCRVEWVELAVPEGQAVAPPFGISIVDPQGLPIPPVGELPAVSGTSVLFPHRASMALGSTWASSERLAQPALLVPGHDYWLSTRLPAPWRVAASVSATAEGIGQMFTRPIGTGTWTQSQGALAFRLIGGPLAPADVPRVERPAQLMLSATPQPFTREMSLRWSGGVGRMSVEIFDVSGRRVRHVPDAGAAVLGSWMWRGEDDQGATLSGGVYFARVTSTTGPAIRQRVVYLR